MIDINKLKNLLDEQKRITSLIEDYLNSYDKKERYYTASELAKILNIERGSINHWIKQGRLTNYKQKQANCKIEIPESEVERITKGTKYENNWINYNSKNNL